MRLDTDFWKQRLHERLSWPEEQAGGFLLASDATDDYCKQLVSEVRKTSPSGAPQWIMVSRRNHFLDVEAMQEAAGHLLNVQKIPLGARRHATDADQEPDAVHGIYAPPTTQTPVALGVRKMMANFAARMNK